MSSESVAYALGGTPTEQQRLIAQAEGLQAHTKWLLDQIGVASGQKTIDVGCGPIGILNLLSARVGRDGVRRTRAAFFRYGTGRGRYASLAKCEIGQGRRPTYWA